jgi:hypothetical protein
MIIRSDGAHLLLITQPDHAALAGRLMEAWQADGLPTRSTRGVVLYATTHHDIGWAEEDAAPRVDPATGRPFDFINMPVPHRQAVWPRAISRLATTSTYVAALVAQHALTIYRRYRLDPAWTGFLAAMERERDHWFTTSQRPDGSSGGTLDPPISARLGFLQDYTVLRMGDLLSLVFCNRWSSPEELEGYAIWMDGDDLKVAPDPFAGRSVDFEVRARRIPARAYESDADLQQAFAQASGQVLVGRMAGAERVPVS